ncbi:NAD-dependent epimerase/dehydratase family protein [Mucilaginibacter sp. X4EP1]|uniref:NAD-dependent epimerase/dehydratase family protein n=1 Tax=Mucilaginibacter sp. X4EP1 TaxID=2723092 RepID=UPI002168DC93|nr:NAD(P)-dependent oxidoreductase [Mucilaginibacter sp. X4EP1]MCS3812967.1 nucleoside-diphosphate-sugar epimerase [Mucilaginibacter sp. X4EP1]
MSNKKVVIIGAAGYVGMELVTQLQPLSGQYDLYAFTRDNGSFLLEGKKITHLTASDVAAHAPFDVIVNLAYPTTAKPTSFPEVNKGILKTIRSLAGSGSKIIHVSTQAVFGFGMDKEVTAGFLKNRRDFPYIEAKLSMENSIKNEFPENDLLIIRLGNVWGPGSGTWTGALANKLLFGQYVATEGKDGYSNITDVKNVASYIIHLIQKDNLKGKHIYHLAEFSDVRWSRIIKLMATELNVEPVYARVSTNYPLTLKDDVTKVLKFPSVGNVYRELVWGRISGSYLRSLIRFLGASKFQKIKKTETRPLPETQVLSKGELTHLDVLSSDKQFKSILEEDWKPAVDFEQSWQIVKNWMKDVGY